MLGLGLQLNKMVNRAGGLPPLASLLTFFSKQRDDTTVINKLDSSGGSDGSIVGGYYGKFNGVDNYILLSDSVLNAESVSFWFNIGVTTRMAIMGGILDDTCIYFNGGKLGSGGSFETSKATDTTWNDNQWHFAEITKLSDGIYEFKIDGVIQSQSCNGGYRDSSRGTIGCTYNFANTFSLFYNGLIYGVNIKKNGVIYAINFSSNLDSQVVERVSGEVLDIEGNSTDFWKQDCTGSVRLNNVFDGFSSLDSYPNGLIPPAIDDPTIDCITRQPLTNPAISKISNLGDGYYKLPSGIKVNGRSLFNKDDPIIYDTSVSTTAEEYVLEDPYLWHVDELNTERILSYLNDAYKFTWFVKNTFTEGTYEPLTIKEIFAYSQKIEDADDLSKIMKYLKINVWYDSQIWDNDAEWID